MANGTCSHPASCFSQYVPRLGHIAEATYYLRNVRRGLEGSQGVGWSVFAVLCRAALEPDARSALSTKQPTWPWRDQLTCLLPGRLLTLSHFGSSSHTVKRELGEGRGSPRSAQGLLCASIGGGSKPVAEEAWYSQNQHRWPAVRYNRLQTRPSYTEPWAVCPMHHGFSILDILDRRHWGNEDCNCGASAASIGRGQGRGRAEESRSHLDTHRPAFIG